MLFPISAPGQYNPEKSSSLFLDDAPKYTFGMKTQTEKPSDTPGTSSSKIEII